MDKHALTAKNSIGHILRGLPADAEEFKEHRATLEKAVELLKDVLAKCAEEAHKSLSATVPREVHCPCNRCKATAYIEVIQSLPYDDLLEMIMWGDVAEGAAAPTDCGAQGTSVDVPQTARPSGGAGDSAPTNTLSLSEC